MIFLRISSAAVLPQTISFECQTRYVRENVVQGFFDCHLTVSILTATVRGDSGRFRERRYFIKGES